MNVFRKVQLSVIPITVSIFLCFHVEAEVSRFEITNRVPLNNGALYGDIGSYEELSGKVFYEVDPQADANSTVVDLDLAPRNRNGMVEFSADFAIILPVDHSKINGTLLYEVNNRGNRLQQLEPSLLNRGFMFVYSGWIAELLPDSTKLRLYAPVAGNSEYPITGLVRAEMVTSKPADRLNINGGGHGAYEPAARGISGATLTVRPTEKAPRTPVSRDDYIIETSWNNYTGVPDGLPHVEVVLKSGFRPGYIYELVYEAKHPVVQGLGFAGIRDIVSYLKYETDTKNPLLAADSLPLVKRTIGLGYSQSGRCLRMFLYDGFNADEKGRKVFDGVIPYVAGGGLGYFNHRFASPTRTNSQHESHSYPVDVFPFAYGNDYDPLTGKTDGILKRSRENGTVPKIMHVQTSAEYWQRSGALVHTGPLGKRDAVIPPEVRIYAIGGSTHGPGDGIPRPKTNGKLQHNPTNYRPILTAQIVNMDAWLRNVTQPPPSRYPRIDGGTLAGWQEHEIGWNRIPGVPYPNVIQQAEVFDYGPEFYEKRITVNQPPNRIGAYPALVPAVGDDNNELGMLLPPNVAVPLGTYTGWNLRDASIGAENQILRLSGSYIPFEKTKENRLETGDPRAALFERYRGFADYFSKYREATHTLVKEGYILEEDAEPVIELAREFEYLFEE